MPKYNYDPSAEDRPRADGRLVLGIADIRGKVGAEREINYSVDLGELGLESAHVGVAGEVALDLVLRVITEGMGLDGTAAAKWVGECRRCLSEVAGDTTAEVHEIFEVHPTEGETYPLGVETVDVEPAVRDAILLALPLTPLCRDDCPGPDPERFPTTVESDEPVERKPDPRWAALEGLNFDE